MTISGKQKGRPLLSAPPTKNSVVCTSCTETALRPVFSCIFVTIQGSGFEAKKQAIFRPSSLLFEGDAAHRLKKEAQDGGKLTFLDQDVSTLNSYFYSPCPKA
jgi:hypothetical protein